jgi:ADP-dependent NAD(P)H-hydrate dehydratase / NAD(P)H-hydrate epimerase
MELSHMEALYTAVQSRALDRCAIEDHGIPGLVLMHRAAQASLHTLLARWPEPPHIQVLCGTGNNGGDGYLIADMAHKRGIPVAVMQLGDVGRITGDAAQARQQALANGVIESEFSVEGLPEEGVIVDAMLGTGLGGDVRGIYSQAIAAVNDSGLPVLAVDIPSGLCSDTGRVLGCAAVADCTVSFIGLKRGLFTLAGADHCGDLLFDDLGVPPEVYQQVPADSYCLDLEVLLESLLPPRPAMAHKGMYGTVLVVGGDYGMAGAALLAGEAALRSGAGLVRVATRAEHVPAMIARCPELMACSVRSGQDLQPLVDTADVLVVGPGLGQQPWAEQLFQVAMASGKPMLLDADALNLLAAAEVPQAGGDNCVLTPHPGEAARLLGISNAEVQADRFDAARALQQRFGGVAVLKGNGSLIASRDSLQLSEYGNPGMASGGMGDTLSGLIGSLMAQGLEPAAAAALGVCVHGAAADLASDAGERGLLASDLMVEIRSLLG